MGNVTACVGITEIWLTSIRVLPLPTTECVFLLCAHRTHTKIIPWTIKQATENLNTLSTWSVFSDHRESRSNRKTGGKSLYVWKLEHYLKESMDLERRHSQSLSPSRGTENWQLWEEEGGSVFLGYDPDRAFMFPWMPLHSSTHWQH